jgi:gliding motility-associatede transport system auxiliary component
MRSPTRRIWIEGLLLALAIGLVAAGALAPVEDSVSKLLYFGAWCAALLLIFLLGLRLPLHLGGRLGLAANGAIAAAALGIVLLGNIALYRHDAYIDATASGRFTAPPELETIARSLKSDVSLTYFYNDQDEMARAARDVLAATARQYPHIRLRALDLDKEPIAARQYGVRLFNTMVVDADGRRTQVENTVDLHQVAFAIARAQKQRTETVCFLTGYGEPFDTRGHVHFSHEETLATRDNPGKAGTIEAPPLGLDRLRLAIAAIGFTERPLAAGSAADIPQDCTVVADIGPRKSYTADEVHRLESYLAQGGRLLLMYDPYFPVAPALQQFLARAGLALENGVVIDPVNHYGTEQDKIAVPYYPPHPITEQLAMTVFPGARAIRVAGKVPGITTTELIASSKDSYLHPLPDDENETPLAVDAAKLPHGQQVIAVSEQGNWPGQTRPFRLVAIGNSAVATNAFFPYVSNGDLVVSAIRWAAGDTGIPALKPATYSLPEITLTHRQMQVTFLLIEVLLPLSVMLFGGLVWWRRR